MASFVQILIRALGFASVLALMVGCGDSFKASNQEVTLENLKFEKPEARKPVWSWVQRDDEAKSFDAEEEDGVDTAAMPKLEVIYGKIHFDQLTAGKDENGLTLKGDFYFDKKKIASDVVFQTTASEGYKQFLKSNDVNLSEVLKASVTCLEDLEPGQECLEFFIDFYYQRDGKIYSDQFTLDRETEAALDEQKKPKEDLPVVKPGEHDHDNDHETESEEEGDDLGHAEALEGDGVVIKHGAYVGTPLLDLWKLFYDKKKEAPVVTPSSTTSSTTTTSTTLPKKSETPPKTETPKVPKADEPKKEEPKKEEPKQEAPKTEEPKQNPAPTPSPTPKPSNGRATKDQSVGKPQKGSIANATNFKQYSDQPAAVFKMLRTEQEKFYGSFNLLTVVNDMGKFIQTLIPGYKIGIKDISASRGGYIRHKSHQNGLDADIRYITKSDGAGLISVLNKGRLTDDLQVDEQWETFKRLVSTNWVVMIYVDKKVKEALCQNFNASPDAKKPEKVEEAKRVFRYLDHRSSGHHNHFHLRIKCGENQPRCRVDTYQMPVPSCLN